MMYESDSKENVCVDSESDSYCSEDAHCGEVEGSYSDNTDGTIGEDTNAPGYRKRNRT